MGSSPFTATICRPRRTLPREPAKGPDGEGLDAALAEFFTTEAPICAGQRLVVAFSGGCDSTALLAALRDLARRRAFELHAAHVDHRLDEGSTRRAALADSFSRRLAVPFHLLSRDLPSDDSGPEEAARRIRYQALEELRRDLAARYIATAHHRDDQAETVALRLSFGSGLAGLEGIRPIHDRLVRPLLRFSRRDLLAALRKRGLSFVEDPTNRDLRRPRNLLRHRLLPLLDSREPRLAERLAALAGTAASARRTWEERLFDLLSPRPVDGGWGLPLGALRGLPREVRALALDLLHRLAGNPYPPTAGARQELWRQLRQKGRLGVDCGAHLRWERRGKLLVVASHETPTPFFSYTLQVPGEVRIAELGVSFRLSPVAEPGLSPISRTPTSDPIAPGSVGFVQRALFGQALKAGEAVEVRNRRPGDRLSLPGARRPRRLKRLLADRKVPFRLRDQLLLACVRGHIMWIPGLGVDGRFRPAPPGPSWLAEISADER